MRRDARATPVTFVLDGEVLREEKAWSISEKYRCDPAQPLHADIFIDDEGI